MGADLPSECAKAAGIIAQFLQPSAIDQLIPADVIARAQGVAVLKVTRLGLHLSGRYGTGVLVARLPDGTWSAPSVIKTAGVGVGFVIGAEVTDAVLILNSAKAVASFTQENVTLGGNLSVAAGPVGRSAEGAVSILNPAPVYSYSKTKGLYAGASLEGSAIIEGNSENARFYGRPVSVREILSGVIPRPQAAAPLYAALQRHEMQASQQPSSSQGAQITITKPNTLMNAYDQQMFPGSPAVNPAYGSPYPAPPPLSGAPQPTSYPPPPSKSNSIYSASASTGAPIISYAVPSSASSSATQPTLAQPVKADYSTGSSTGAPVTSYAAPSYAMPPPSYSDHDRTFLSTPPQQAGAGSVLALFDYASETPGDLSFKAGETIVVRERSTDGWWRGSVAGRMQEEGVFPSNFVRDA